MSGHDRSVYRSYLLRLWRHSSQGSWRVSLQTVETGQTHHFANLKELWVFLQGELVNEYRQEADRPTITRPESSGLRPGAVCFGKLQPSTAGKTINIILLTAAALIMMTLLTWSIVFRPPNRYLVAPTRSISARTLTTTPVAAATPNSFPVNLQEPANSQGTVPTASSVAEFEPEATLTSVADQLAYSASTGKLKGDLNGDGRVDRRDLELIAARYKSSDPAADLNADGRVDLLDLSALARLVEPNTGGGQVTVSPSAGAISKVEATATSPPSTTFTVAPPIITGADAMTVPLADTSPPAFDAAATEPPATSTSLPTAIENPIASPTTAPIEATATPTDTPPATDMETPIAEESGWAFAGIRVATEQIPGAVMMYGELINNTGSAQKLTGISGTFYDPAGQLIPEPDSALSSPWCLDEVLPAGGRVPFGLPILSEAGVADYELQVQAEPSGATIRQDLELTELNPADDEYGSYCVSGKIQGSDLEESLTIALTLYDDQDKVINFGFFCQSFFDYGGGSKIPDFQVCGWTPEQEIARYELQAWGR